MLSTPVGIFAPSSSGGGVYTFQLFFQSAGSAPFLRVGDYVKDTAGNQYEVTTWVGSPSDFSSGAVVTTTFVDTDVLPVADVGFTSTVFTPSQVDVRPAMQTPGSIFSISLTSGQSFEYELSATWTVNSEALKAVVGDRVVDSLGKEFEITFLDPSLFTVPFKMKEVEAEGISPAVGIATLYRQTDNEDYFQGSELTDPARTNIFNRDKFLIDARLKELAAAIAGGGGTGDAVEVTRTNGSGSAMSKLLPVRANTSGELDTVDPTIEAEALAILGITKESILSGATGQVVSHGRVNDVTTSAVFGDAVYLSKTGGVTNVQPDIGVGGFVAGDIVIKLGVIAKNEANPVLKDLEVNIELIGQL